jgi:hypothetical protein
MTQSMREMVRKQELALAETLKRLPGQDVVEARRESARALRPVSRNVYWAVATMSFRTWLTSPPTRLIAALIGRAR